MMTKDATSASLPPSAHVAFWTPVHRARFHFDIVRSHLLCESAALLPTQVICSEQPQHVMAVARSVGDFPLQYYIKVAGACFMVGQELSSAVRRQLPC